MGKRIIPKKIKNKLTELTEDRKFPTVNIEVSIPKTKQPKAEASSTSKESSKNEK